MPKPSKWDNDLKNLLSQIHANKTLSPSGTRVMSDIVCHLSDKICGASVLLTMNAKKQTIGSKEIETVILLLIRDDLAKYSIVEANKAVDHFTKFNESTSKNKKPVSDSTKAKIIFSVAKAESDIRTHTSNKLRVGVHASIWLAYTLEYLSAEILEMAGAKAFDSKELVITPQHINQVILDDEEFATLLKDVVITEGGVLPYIHPIHLQKKKGGSSINNITKNALQRIAYRAGVKSMSGLIYEELRSVLQDFLQEKIISSLSIMELNDRKTLTREDLEIADKSKALLNYNGIGKIVGGRNKPGTVALKKIKEQQNKVDFNIPRAPFQRLVRENADHIKDLRFSASFMNAIQTMSEAHLIKLLKYADLIAIHSGHQTITPKDLLLVRAILNYKL